MESCVFLGWKRRKENWSCSKSWWKQCFNIISVQTGLSYTFTHGIMRSWALKDLEVLTYAWPPCYRDILFQLCSCTEETPIDDFSKSMEAFERDNWGKYQNLWSWWNARWKELCSSGKMEAGLSEKWSFLPQKESKTTLLLLRNQNVAVNWWESEKRCTCGPGVVSKSESRERLTGMCIKFPQSWWLLVLIEYVEIFILKLRLVLVHLDLL